MAIKRPETLAEEGNAGQRFRSLGHHLLYSYEPKRQQVVRSAIIIILLVCSMSGRPYLIFVTC
jgi:hypothetical protein